MLKRLSVHGFKSIVDAEIKFSRITLLLGPLGSGKSSILRALNSLSNMATAPLASDALARANQGDWVNAFTLCTEEASARTLMLEADLSPTGRDHLRYRIALSLSFSGEGAWASVTDEYLVRLSRDQVPVKEPARIEKVGATFKIRRKKMHSPPYIEDVGLPHALLSDPRLSGTRYPDVEKCRTELSSWRTFRFSQSSANPVPGQSRELRDVGPFGELLLPFLRKLQLESPGDFKALQNALSQVVEGAQELSVTLDERFGVLDLQLKIHGVFFPAGALPEGLIRVIALLATVVNPWSGHVIAVDEPENGLDPKTSGLLGEVLMTLAMKRNKQLILSTHSPWLCEAVVAHQQAYPKDIVLYHVQNKGAGTTVSPYEGMPLFGMDELSQAIRE